ncbi:hypothetical protein ACIQYF_22100 [Pseudomonas sp. NPDC096917]|uniref:hypothetical protein n=1 Tax=Pseudomonas sp. NPDC096917 TaxID=3364483 RepID=UPI00383B0196
MTLTVFWDDPSLTTLDWNNNLIQPMHPTLPSQQLCRQDAPIDLALRKLRQCQRNKLQNLPKRLLLI